MKGHHCTAEALSVCAEGTGLCMGCMNDLFLTRCESGIFVLINHQTGAKVEFAMLLHAQ